MPSTKISSAFTLIEIVAVCAVIGILLAVISPVIGRQVAQAKVAAETSQLQKMAAAVQASFESTDLEATNLAAIPIEPPLYLTAALISSRESALTTPVDAVRGRFIAFAQGYLRDHAAHGTEWIGIPEP